ncbi:MAG: hypothetical protein M3Z98_07705 [Candidatus Dormibacteraeota bacterium]|nr:hypothetical protein [Candidatus Dormibacteraeota bacterium]
MLAAELLLALVLGLPFQPALDKADGTQLQWIVATLAAYIVVSAVLSIAALVLGHGALIAIAGGTSDSAREALRVARHRAGAVLGALLLITLLAVAAEGLLLTASIGLAALAGVAGYGHGQALAFGLFAIGSAFVPLLVFARFALALQAAVLEELGPLDAIRRSAQVTAHRYWHILATLVVLAALGWVVGGALGLAGVAVFGSSPLAVLWVRFASAGLAALLFGPVPMLVLTRVYLRERRRAEAVTEQPAGRPSLA